MSDETFPELTFEDLDDLTRSAAPEDFAEYVSVLRAHTPLDPELLVYLDYNSRRALSWDTTPEQALAIGERLMRWWREIKALVAADAETDAHATRLIGVIACGPDAMDPARSVASKDRELLELVRWRTHRLPNRLVAENYCEELLDTLNDLIHSTLRAHHGVTLMYPFYSAITVGSLAHVQAAADWCSPSHAAVEFGLLRAIKRNGYRLDENPQCADDEVKLILEWLFARVGLVDVRTLLVITALQSDEAYLEFYRRMLFLCPALTPQAAGALLADPEWEERSCGWARGALEEIARREWRFAWIAAVVTARARASAL